MKSPLPTRPREAGYILITLMLFVALLAIGSLAWIEKVDFQMKRDREEELIHRGVQYSRAVRRYVKKFGRYPSRIEELESTSNVRYLRKRYKDPITGKDFKLLHENDMQNSFSPGAASGLPPGAAGSAAAPGALNGAVSSPGGSGPSAIPSDSQPDQNDQTDQSAQNADESAQNNAGPTGGNPGFAGSQRASGQPGVLRASAAPVNPQTFGGGAILGVASTSKGKTIRQFNKKDHYNQWQFIYDPTTDRGGLITTPNQPQLQVAIQMQNNQQENGTQNQGTGFGQGGINSPQQPNPQQPKQQQ